MSDLSYIKEKNMGTYYPTEKSSREGQLNQPDFIRCMMYILLIQKMEKNASTHVN